MFYHMNNIWGDYTDEQVQIINKWRSRLENDIELTAFRDAEFLDEFLLEIPEEEQFKYVENTVNYVYNKEYNPNYVLVFRRAVPSSIPKPETFWSTEYRVPRFGLKSEIPLGTPQRLHSVIMVSTLSSLEKHGVIETSRSVSDGEISIDYTKSFTDFLFMYKPYDELYDLKKYLDNGGKCAEELLTELSQTAKKRIQKQFELDRVVNNRNR